jgi:HEAT repeat protein
MTEQFTTRELRWRVLLRRGQLASTLRLVTLASVVGAAAPAHSESSGEPWWPGTVAAIGAEIDSLDRGRRLQAVLALAAYTGPEATGLLLEAMRDLDVEVRTEAARVLAARGQADAIITIERWVATGTAGERAAGLEALRLRPSLSAGARAAVLRALGDSEPGVRLAALAVLCLERFALRLPALDGSGSGIILAASSASCTLPPAGTSSACPGASLALAGSALIAASWRAEMPKWAATTSRRSPRCTR